LREIVAKELEICQLWQKIVLFFLTLTEKITDKSVDVPVDFVDVTIRAENN
jgi:hypothetical protein